MSGRPFFCAFFTLWSWCCEPVRSTDHYICMPCYDKSVFLLLSLQFEHVLKQKGKNGSYSVDTLVTRCTERECIFMSTTLMPYRFAVLCVLPPYTHTHTHLLRNLCVPMFGQRGEVCIYDILQKLLSTCFFH